ncbi:MAG: ribosome biogenesis GTP-binding protein YihA/YsxC [Desulfobacterales bacterium]|jgi:GTP-binding protein
MIIQSAAFVKSAIQPEGYPAPDLPEIAFAGRSNVGKSSLINVLVNRKRLVKTSATPGRTQLLNFFRINDRFCFVDLPGYGYAKVPEAVRRRWGPMVEGYLSKRSCLRGVILILDIRRTPRDEELDLLHWLADRRIPACTVLTKIDKLSKSRRQQRRKAVAEALAVPVEDLVLFSAKTRQGRNELWNHILVMTDADGGRP